MSPPEKNIPQFKGDCYGAWKFRIKTVLEELQAYSVIEGPVPENPDDEWTAKNTIAKGTIVNFLGDAFLHLAEGSTTAKSIIDKLDRLYQRRNLTAQVALRKSLARLKFHPYISLSQHLSRFDKLISELTSSGANFDEMDKVCQLLATLPPCYNGVIGHLEEFYGDNFNLAFVKTYLLDQEAKMEMETVRRLKDTMTETSNKRSKPNNQYKYCKFCGRNNHFIQDCRFYNGQNGNGNVHRSGPPAPSGPRNIFSAMFPKSPPKSPKRLKQKVFINKTQNLRLVNFNPYSVPNIKAEGQITVKEEPVTVKTEVVEIKQEPMWVKQEPQWDEWPIKTEPGAENTTEPMNVQMESSETSQHGTYAPTGAEISMQGPSIVKMEPGTVYFIVPKRKKQRKI